ncbi:hypothetical protein [Mucilaginibacter sp. dw_454]|uniref:hypothetical protein n=1 Tax=Mucilaginibacter sp. dw_454 TaxID=2720079 RepID=UPI001BD6CF68|nr:hypothetical protein [Mucilaginibacter sp. dw_454]
MKTYKLFILFALAITVFYSCKKEDTIGGKLFDAHVNMTTYDYLKTNHLFDTLVIMIDKMNLKDEVNSSGTFFAITNYDIHNYVLAKQNQLQIQNNDENLKFTFDSLNFTTLKDSLRAYMFKGKYTRDNLNATGTLATADDGELRLIQLIPTTAYTGTLFPTEPEYINLTKLVANQYFTLPPVLDTNTVKQLDPSQFLRTVCQTTGILTTTGVLHVLSNDHTFTYFNNVDN